MNNRILCLAFFVTLIAVNAFAMDGAYSVIIEENGAAAVILSVDGAGTVDVPLPLDVETYAVDGAVYVPSGNGVELLVEDGTPATLIFDTALLTAKSGDSWFFEMETADFDSGSVQLFLPANTKVSSTSPAGSVSDSADSKIVNFALGDGVSSVSAQYSFVSAPPAGGGTETPETPSGGGTLFGFDMGTLLLVLAVLVILVGGGLAYFKKKA